jgi:hypothetical protein
MLVHESLNMRELSNCMFIIFLLSFFIFAYQTGIRRHMLLQMLDSLFRSKERESIFNESTGSETIDKIIFVFQSLLLISIVIFTVYVREYGISTLSSITALRLFGSVFCLLSAFVIFRFASVWLIGNVFFSSDYVKAWNICFTAILCLTGPIVFIPAVLIFYVEPTYKTCTILIILYLILAVLISIFRVFSIFFYKNSRFFYFILYLCTLEAIPLYLLYKAFVSIV